MYNGSNNISMALGRLIFWQLLDEFLEYALTKDKFGDKIKPRCS